jgi:uncharacterized protein (TIGR02611 family)
MLNLKQARRLVVAVVGGTVILFGVVLLVIPGPGLLTIALGLAILASEFLWARRILARFKEQGSKIWQLLFGRRGDRETNGPKRTSRTTSELQG